MSTPASTGTSPPTAHRQDHFPSDRTWMIGAVVATIMVGLALGGVALTTTSSSFAATYWVALVPIFGILCVATAWMRAEKGEGFKRTMIGRQVFHWLGIGIALGLDFSIRRAGEETGIASGLNALLLLALGCFLAGVHFEWPFLLVGLLLTAVLILVVTADQYLWLIFIAGAVSVFAIFGLRVLHRRATSGH
jgi:MFS family permease